MMKTVKINVLQLFTVFAMVAALFSCGGADMDENKPPVNPYNGHEYVDLGLSVKWATCNIGASQPWEYGEYFAWGETEGSSGSKTSFFWDTYKWCNGSNVTLTKYCTDSDYGTVDNKTTLKPEDDAATVNWGSAWRMPTYDEIEELNNNCYWEWTWDYKSSGIEGCIVYKVKADADRGKKISTTTEASYTVNDTHIFLPAVGSSFGNVVGSTGTRGYYWSSTIYSTTAPCYAWNIYVAKDGMQYNYALRLFGHCVRPVTTR